MLYETGAYSWMPGRDGNGEPELVCRRARLPVSVTGFYQHRLQGCRRFYVTCALKICRMNSVSVSTHQHGKTWVRTPVFQVAHLCMGRLHAVHQTPVLQHSHAVFLDGQTGTFARRGLLVRVKTSPAYTRHLYSP